jgi:uncharacterized protein YukE
MKSPVMRVDAEALRGAVPDLAAVAAAVDTTLTHLHDALAAEGECWGQGELGSSFGGGYGRLRDQAEQAFGDLSRGIASMGAAFGSVADAAQAADARAVGRLL